MKVTINPLALSSLLNDLSVGSSEAEGMLLGKISKCTSTTLGDHDVDEVKNSFQINITAHFSKKIGDHCDLGDCTITYHNLPIPPSDEALLPITYSQYLSSLTKEFKDSLVVGWFRFSRSMPSPHVPSLHDLKKQDFLSGLLPEDVRPAFVFLSLTESYNEDCGVGVKGFDRALFHIARKDALRANWERIELLVVNLGDTDAGKRYSSPRADVEKSDATKLERRIVHAQGKNLKDLEEYSRQQVKQCDTSLAQYLDLYESAEGPLVREILELEKRLGGNVVTPVPSVQVSPVKPHPIFAAESLTDNTASTSKDFLKDLNHNDNNNDENESLPSPSIQSTEKGSSYDWGESQDIIPATQFQHAPPEDIIPETQIDEESQDKASNGTDEAALETTWETGREKKPEKIDADSQNKCRAISKGDGRNGEEKNGAVNGSTNKDGRSIKSDSPTDRENEGKGDGKGKDPNGDDAKAETKKVKRKDPEKLCVGKTSKKRRSAREKSPSI